MREQAVMDMQQCEIVKERLLELTDMLSMVSLPLKEKAMVMAALPLLKMEIRQEETQKLLRFLTCLNEMLRDVLDSGSSRLAYEVAMEGHIETLASLLTRKGA